MFSTVLHPETVSSAKDKSCIIGSSAYNPQEKGFEGPSNMLASMYLLGKTRVEMYAKTFDYKVYLL